MFETSTMFNDWTNEGKAILEYLQPLVLRHGAEFYHVDVRRQIRVGWTNDTTNHLLATLNCRKSGVLVTLHVGRHSGLIGSNGSLYPDSTPDSGRVILRRSDIPERLPECIDAAFAFTMERFGIPVEGLHA